MRSAGVLAGPVVRALPAAPAVPRADRLQRALGPLRVGDGTGTVLRPVSLPLNAAQRRMPGHGHSGFRSPRKLIRRSSSVPWNSLGADIERGQAVLSAPL